MRRWIPWSIALALLGAVPVKAGIVLEFDADGVEASGLVPGGTAALFGLSREATGWSVRVVTKVDLVADDDGDGRVAYRPERGLAPASVWAVVDLSSGALAVSGPPGSPFEETGFKAARDLSLDSRGQLRRLRHNFQNAHVLVARPGVGAWRLAASEGGPRDHGPADDERVDVDLGEAAPVGTTSEPFDELKSGDVLIAIDTRGLRFFAVRFKGGAREESQS